MNVTGEVITIAVTVGGAIVATLGGIAKLWIQPVVSELTSLKTRVAALEQTEKERSNQIETAVRAGTEQISGEIKKLDKRLYAHVADEDRHITQAWVEETTEWRKELMGFMREINQRTFDLMKRN